MTPLYAALNCEWAPKSLYPQPRAYLNQKVGYLDLMEPFAGFVPPAEVSPGAPSTETWTSWPRRSHRDRRKLAIVVERVSGWRFADALGLDARGELLDRRAYVCYLIGEFDEALLKDRRILRDEGFISVIVVIDAATGKIAAGPEIQARGFAEDDEIFSQVRPKIEQALAEATGNGVTDSHQLEQVMRRAIGGWVGGKIRRRPMIIPVVIQA